MQKLNDRLSGAGALLGGALTFSSFGLLIRLMEPMFGNGAQVTFRFSVALLLLLGWVVLFKKSIKLPRAVLVRSACLGVAFGLSVVLFTMTVTETTIANSIFLLYAGSIITSLVIGTVVFKEKLGVVKLVAIGLAILGLSMYSSGLASIGLALVLAFVSGIFDGIGNGFRKTLRGVDRNISLIYQFAFASLFTGLLLFLPDTVLIKEVSFWSIVAGVAFAVLQIGVGNLLLYGFQHFDVNVGTVILATELFFASLVGLVFFGEVPTLNEMLGGALIFVASILSAVDVTAFFGKRKSA